MKKFYLFHEKNRKIIDSVPNPKAHEILYKYLYKFCEIRYFDIFGIKKFINANNNENIYLFYYAEIHITPFHINFIKFLHNFKNLKINIIIFTFDWWFVPHKLHNLFISEVFKAKNYKVFCYCYNIEQLNFIHRFNYNNYKENIILSNNWCCYSKSFCKYKKNTINKLLLSGRISANYPERVILNNLKFNKIKKYNYNKSDKMRNNNNYNLELNKHFACFTSSVYIKRKLIGAKNNDKFYSSKKMFGPIHNTHMILLKTFEILASGSLLVMPKKEEEYLKNFGLINNVNCYLIDFSKNIKNQINHIFNNIENYNIVRKKGQELAKEKFNLDNKINEIKKLLK